MAAAQGDLRTLDLKEPQIIRHYPHDQNQFYWHHRLLLQKVSPGIWIGLTPDYDLERIDLHTTEHLPLERRSPFPPAQSAYIYAFDDIPRAELERQKRRAATMASLFNDTAVEDMEAFEWMVGDLSHPKFGEAVPDEMVDQGVVMGDLGIVVLDGKETFVKKIPVSSKAKIIEDMDAMRGDIRLLGDHRDSQNHRFLSFKDAMALMSETAMQDWPLQGPRVMMELLKAIRSGPGDLATYHLSWSRSSGVNTFSMACHEHRIICNVFRAAIETDQFNLPNSLSFEILARRLVQVETAVARSPTSPDFTGLELILEDPVGTGGEAVTSTFNTWLASKLKEKANVAKQTRLYREEFRTNPNAPSDASGGVGKGDVKGRGRGNKGKAKSPGAASGSGAPQ